MMGNGHNCCSSTPGRSLVEWFQGRLGETFLGNISKAATALEVLAEVVRAEQAQRAYERQLPPGAVTPDKGTMTWGVTDDGKREWGVKFRIDEKWDLQIKLIHDGKFAHDVFLLTIDTQNRKTDRTDRIHTVQIPSITNMNCGPGFSGIAEEVDASRVPSEEHHEQEPVSRQVPPDGGVQPK